MNKRIHIFTLYVTIYTRLRITLTTPMPAPLESVYLEGSNPLQPVDAAPHRAGHNHVTHVLLRFILRELQQLQAYTCALAYCMPRASTRTRTCTHTLM